MKAFKMFCLIAMALLICSTMAVAGDFGWMDDFNITAQADPSGFRARLATRFHIGPAEVSAVIGDVADPADAYMVFRLGELAHRPPDMVLREYKAGRGKGWGVLAKSLGIKPGSAEFHALKRGHDLDGPERGGRGGKNKDKGGKGKGGHGGGGKDKGGHGKGGHGKKDRD